MSVINNHEKRIPDRRKTLLGNIEKAVWLDDEKLLDATLDSIDHFNDKKPEFGIGSKNIEASLKARARSSSKTLNGIYLDKMSEHLRVQGRFADYD
ncbi:hypothetical protein AHAT_38940 [Agarivorans sp. Toyoura001]|uniref:hypothetical protein n=1 Tax=Agarivorans sp. Toyoura001 TaxID=2283141 RepID=UPI0010D9CA14|nr:hypothetical protein [Agarivorans sp. Toyoura001]GDY28004.1 hypothetical protein AHAT_38940 [Agarivorans sp. Toyoura001]